MPSDDTETKGQTAAGSDDTAAAGSDDTAAAGSDEEEADGTAGSSLETVSLDGDGDASARTPAFGGDPRAVSLSLEAGESIPRHEHPGETVLLLVREGTASVTVGDRSRSLSSGDLARFDGADGVAIDALSDVSALVILAAGGDGDE